MARLPWKWLQIGTDMLLVITSSGDELLRNAIINDLEPPKLRVLVKKIFAILGCDTYFCVWIYYCITYLFFCLSRLSFVLTYCRIEVVIFQEWIMPKWLEIDQDNLHTKFSPLNVDFSCPSTDPLRSKRPAHAGVKEGTPALKMVIFSLLACLTWKRWQIGTDMLLIISSTGDVLFSGVKISDLKWPSTAKKEFSVFFSPFSAAEDRLDLLDLVLFAPCGA